MDVWDVIIIGGGPAGLFAAARCGAAGLRVCLLESNRSAGKKLLITGQGKCNITNTQPVQEFITRYGAKTRFVRKCLYSFSNSDLMNYFSSAGLSLQARDDGKVFPASESAAEVLNHLLNLCRKSDVSIQYGRKVDSILYEKNTFKVISDDYSAESENLIIAAGGFTYPSTGSDGSGYKLAESLGHSIIKPEPSLTGIVAAQQDYSSFISCAGISIDCELSLLHAGSKTGSYSGRLLFTHKGLSGPLIIDNSRDFSAGDELELNLLSGVNREQASNSFIEYCAAHGKSSIKGFFTAFSLPDRLVSAVFIRSESTAAPSARAADITAADRKKLLNAFCSLTIGIRSPEGRNSAMCTAGGIDTSEINPATMESKILPGLYFAGEVIDVDGDSGGFNLQYAFSSAAAAASAITKL